MAILRRFFNKRYDLYFTVLLISLYFSFFVPGHVVLSLCVIALVIYSLMLLGTGDFKFGPTPIANWFFIAYYITILISGIWAVDFTLFIEKSMMKSMLIGIPFVFLIYKHLPSTYYNYVAIFIVCLILLSSIYVFYNFSQEIDHILNNIQRGKHVFVPFKNHIRYSIFANLAFLMSIQRANSFSKRKTDASYWIWIIISLYLFFYIQFLAVKSGIVMSFIIIICFAVHKILQSKEYIMGAVLLVAFCLFSVLIISKFPTVKSKISYFKRDMSHYQNNNSQNYSDGERLVSIKKGIEIIRHVFPWGVGEGNIGLYMVKPGEDVRNVKVPHNQFIVVLAQNGFFSLILFCLGMLSFVVTSFNTKNWLLFAYTASMIFALIVEPMLESQLGLALFIIPLNMFNSLKNVHV